MFRLSVLFLLVAVAALCCTVRADEEVVEEDTKDTRIKGGKAASQDQIPYIVSLQYPKFDYVAKKFCSGTIIATNYIVTAAHCVDFDPTRGKRLYVVAGVTDAFDYDKAQIRLVERSVKHPEYKVYDNSTAVNDVAVLKLKSDLEFGPLVRAVELPEDDYVTAGVGVISGWGATRNPPVLHQSRNLLFANVDVVPNESCKLLNDANTQFCIGGINENACGGDSGAPMVQQIPNGPQIVAGISSYGQYGCGDEPSVFTKVSAFVDFIRTNIES